MKLSLIFAAVLATLSLTAAEKVIFQDSFDNASKWFRNGKNGQFNFAEKGRSGKCLHITTKDYVFMCNIRKGMPVKEGAKVKFSFFAKGKGFITTAPMGRKGNKMVAYLKGNAAFKINEADWKEFSFTIPFKDVKNKPMDTLAFRMNFMKNSDLMVDDFKITVIE